MHPILCANLRAFPSKLLLGHLLDVLDLLGHARRNRPAWRWPCGPRPGCGSRPGRPGDRVGRRRSGNRRFPEAGCAARPASCPAASLGQVSAKEGHEPTSSQRSGMGMAATRTAGSREAGSITAKSMLVFFSVGKIRPSTESRSGVSQAAAIAVKPFPDRRLVAADAVQQRGRAPDEHAAVPQVAIGPAWKYSSAVASGGFSRNCSTTRAAPVDRAPSSR